MNHFYLSLLHLVAILHIVNCDVYTIRNIFPPDGARGGEPFDVQPRVAVFAAGVLAGQFSGSVYVEIGSSPIENEPLYVGGCSAGGNCGSRVSRSNRELVPFVKGVAYFENLTIEREGTYTLRFIGVDSDDVPFAFTYSEEFNVTVGDAYQLQLKSATEPPPAYGGSPFPIQPLLAITDRGGNVVPTISGYNVTVSLGVSPEAEAILYSSYSLTQPFQLGYAQFHGLTINKTGYAYNLHFVTNMELEGLTEIATNNFTVAIGPPAYMTFTTPITDEDIRAGEFFPIPPRIEIRDAGGNILIYDNTSRVMASFYDDPYFAHLGPSESLVTQSQQGIVKMSSLRIVGAVGNGYRLGFRLSTFNALARNFTETSIQLLTKKFYLHPGYPRKVTTVVRSDDAWAGGSPFNIQPVLAIQDYANNIMLDDSVSTMQAHVVESLSANKQRVVVNTSDANATLVRSVRSNLNATQYGAGELVEVYVEFEYEVWVLGSTAPYISLSILSLDGSRASANLTGVSQQTRLLTFQYVVQPGDVADEFYINSTSLHAADDSIVDGNDRPGDISLPILNISATIDTTPPEVISLQIDKTDGEYGAGEVMYLIVTFDSPITVEGSPFLELNLTNASTLTASSSVAVYESVSKDQINAYFLYMVAPGDAAEQLLLRNASIRIPDGAYIRRAATTPTTDINAVINSTVVNNFATVHFVSIDTTAPLLNATFGVRSLATDGLYYPGDRVAIALQFDKEIAIAGLSIALRMDVGNLFPSDVATSAALVGLEADNRTLVFEYTVTSNAVSSALDILAGGAALTVFGDGSYIRRASTNPTTDCDVSTAMIAAQFNNSLPSSAVLVIDGIQTTALSTSAYLEGEVTSPENATNVFVDELIFINVTFSTPVVFTCNPVLVMQMLTSRKQAIYASGNNTDVITFQYTVEIGDESNGLYHRHLPNALCADETCANVACHMYTSSASPVAEINYIMPWAGRSKKYGMPIEPNIIVTNSFAPGAERGSSIVAVAATSAPGEVATGATIYFSVALTDDVFLSVRRPVLALNNGRNATYMNGAGSKVLAFMLLVRDGDDVSELDIDDSVESAVICDAPCTMRNRNGSDFNTSTIGLSMNSNILIDTTLPYVVDVWSDDVTSPYDGVYTAGHAIFISVLFSKIVSVTTVEPRLQMDVTTSYDRYALYRRDLSNGTILVFEYRVEYGDYAENLKYTNILSLENNDGNSNIYRMSPVPTVEVNYTLPTPAPLARNGNVLFINTFDVPVVVDVSSSPSGRYAIGDIVDVYVAFSHYVFVSGDPYITLNLGDRLQRAQYVRVDNEPVKVMHFQYEVQLGDYSLDLSYVDVHSLQLGYTIYGDIGVIAQAATYPTIPANLELPPVDRSGSMSYNADVVVDGREAYLTSISFISPLETIYSVGDVIEIAMNFSAPVVVHGEPFILLETGVIDREAYYSNGNGTSTLVYEYYPQPGDSSNMLDYKFDRVLLRTAAAAFNLNDGKILTASAHPKQPAFVHLNPIRGALTGTTEAIAIEGMFEYEDLTIRQQGPDFLLYFVTSPNITAPTNTNSTMTLLSTTQPLFVSFSSEFILRPVNAEKGDRIGYSVDTIGDISVVGAPNTNLRVIDVQTVTTTIRNDTSLVPVQEVQLIRAEVERIPEIQMFHTTADVDETIGGSFTINYGILGPTRRIPANANSDMIAAIIMEDLPKLGIVSVSREQHIFCACHNAYTWHVTFQDLESGVVDALVITSFLEGSGARVVGPATVQNSSSLTGTFTISALGRESSDIAIDADDNEIIAAVTEIGLSAVQVHISPTNDVNSRTWTITFGSVNGSYEMPLLSSNSSKLNGGGGHVDIWHSVARPGRHGPIAADGIAGISGSFQLEWRGNITRMLDFNASAEDVMYALQDLPVIDYVSVTRDVSYDSVGYTWVITMLQVFRSTPRGYVVDDRGPYEAIIAHNHLIGSNTTITIGSKSNANIHSYGAEVRGEYGDNAGAVYIYQRYFNEFDEVITIIANDTDAQDQFGSSVALTDNILVVGAMGNELIGVPEKQSIFCSATSGYFSLSLRGYTTPPIPFNIDRDDFIEAIRGDLNKMDKLHTLHAFTVDDWGPSYLCDNNTAIITFESPVDGQAKMFGVDNRADIEDIQISSHTLFNNFTNTSGIVSVTEVQKGTRKWHNADSDGMQCGSVYIFRPVLDCSDSELFCTRVSYTQEAQFYPTDIVGGEEFGAAVQVDGDVVAVGAPGSLGGKGAVYIFTYDGEQWRLRNKRTASTWIAEFGDRFGSAIALYSATLAVGAPGRRGSTGAVFIFKQTSVGSFASTQQLTPPAAYFTPKEGDLFGQSVAIDNDLIVIGAPGIDDEAIYFGNSVNPAAMDTGAVFLFRRKGLKYDYLFDQMLVPSNVRRLDGFGFDVAISDKTIIVSSLEMSLDETSASKAVMLIETTATYNQEYLGTGFRLRWVMTNETSVWQQRTTRVIPHDASALVLKRILQQDLQTGPVRVSRSKVDMYNGGYIWTVTFMSDAMYSVANLEYVDDGFLTGTNASVQVTIVNPTPPFKRGKSHIFTKTDYSATWTEQVFLIPYRHERVDRCGYSVAIQGDYAVMGCPNRDLRIPNSNSGAAFMFDLNFLNLEFSDLVPFAVEGDTIEFSLVYNDRGTVSDDIMYFVGSLDRNADAMRQTLISNLFGLYDIPFDYSMTAVDMSGTGGTAIARTQYYGSEHNESAWVDGMYDYRGLADYVQIDVPTAHLLEYTNLTETIITNPDTILEAPDEILSLVIHAPGYWPSYLGELFATATIEDNADGYVMNNNTYLFQYDKMYADSEECPLGSSVAVNEDIDLIVAGCPHATIDGVANAGKILLYRKVFDQWALIDTIISPNKTEDGKFGEAVALDKSYGRNMATLLIGEPGTYSAHAYETIANSTEELKMADWTISTSLTENTNGSFVVQHRYAAFGTLALDDDIAVVGAPGLETIFIYTRTYDVGVDQWLWSDGEAMQSIDFDFDLFFSLIVPHRQEFGTSVGASGRLIAVGSPYADYDKLGSNNIEINWSTEGSDIFGFSRGKVYIYNNAPPVQMITIVSYHQLKEGAFRLQFDHQGRVETTDLIPFDATAENMTNILEALINIDRVFCETHRDVVDFNDTNGYYYSWSVTFASEWSTPPLLVPIYNISNCTGCAFDVGYLDNTTRIAVETIVEAGSWQHHSEISASDKRRGDRFGKSLSLDGDQIAIGAVDSAGVTTTTWDFETGTLQGWYKTGTAFDHQPTFGDNSYHRAVYRGTALQATGEKSGVKGRYYIGTFERHPGSSVDYAAGDTSTSPGDSQGDEPIGTLTSNTFMIRGKTLSFLIGGGCDPYLLYVELLVDGMSMMKATGKCSERMERVTFNVEQFKLKTAQLRIVDASHANWGHINVDDFSFSWDVKGGEVISGSSRQAFGGQVEMSRSGAVYVYGLYESETNGFTIWHNHCGVEKQDCVWIEEAKVTSSDKRRNDQFGTSIALNSDAGVLVVGSPYTQATGFYKETPSVYPHSNVSGYSDVAGLVFPVNSQNMKLFITQPVFTPQASGALGVQQLREIEGVYPDLKAYENSGGVYVFTKTASIRNHSLGVAHGTVWTSAEHAKIQAPDVFARDLFGSSVALSGGLMAVGAVGQDGLASDSGALYIYRTDFSAVSFQQPVFSILENQARNYVTIVIFRDLNIYAGHLVLEYSTSDLTAKGVDDDKYAECMGMSTALRAKKGCGDYRQTRGLVTILPGDDRGTFIVPIINDLCKERYMEFIQISISVPGSAALQGETVTAKIRIDDDDFAGEKYC